MKQHPEAGKDLSTLKRAYLALNDIQARLDAVEQARNEPIAIIGMGCRFPGGVKNPADFWELLRTGRDAITEVPAERWDADAYYDPDVDAPGKMTSRWGGFLDHADQLDAAFFGIAPREAMYMDPQQRLLLEISWEALEQAGQTMEALAGSRTGIFVGICNGDYPLIQSPDPADIDFYVSTGSANTLIANRLSYILDLRGPSIVLDTACSSSLVALHLACQSLRSEECTLAIAGGVNMILSPLGMISLSKAHMLASDGRCKTFDNLADGFVRGEGCGVVVLKRLSQAQKDGDPILALVRGSAVNQDGHSNGLTAPNVQGQQAVIRQALQQAHIPAEQMGFIETHGTGTPLGDPIEVEALRAVYGAARSDGSQCALGAVKTNLGHLEGAAGVAGLIKTVLALQNGEVPPNLHFRALNPNILLEQTPFVIPTNTLPWPTNTPTRYAAVSSFGLGGTNAHVILEAPPQESVQVAEKQAGSNPIALLPLSARSPEALTQLALAYTSYLQHFPDDQLVDLCFTASQRRSHHPYRLAVLGHQRLELLEQLQIVTTDDVVSASRPSAITRRPLLVLVFPGQGSQWSGMGRDLLEQEPVFRQAMQRCAQVIEPLVSWSLLDVLADPSPEALAPIDVIQPVLFAIQVSLAVLWHSWGITPDAVIGHSMGEVAAAHVAGILSLEDAARVICRRSRLLRRISGQGAMALVELSLSQAQTLIVPWADRLSVAVSNSPRSTVLSGDPTALASVLQQLETQGVFSRWVKVDVASHSPQVDTLHLDLLEALADLHPQVGLVPLYSTVTAAPIEGTLLDAAYWFNNLRQPVRFAEGVRQLLGQGYSHFVELSPHPILVPALEEGLRESGEPGLVVASLRRQEESVLHLRRALAALYVSGVTPHWHHLQPTGHVVPLPAYPWQHERFWLPKQRIISSGSHGAEVAVESDTLRDALADRFYELQWEAVALKDVSVAQEPGEWLIFADDGGVGLRFQEALQQRGASVTLVYKAETFARLSEHIYQLNPLQEDAFTPLFKQHWGKQESTSRHIVYLWACGEPLHEQLETARLGHIVETLCVEFLALVQALAHSGWRDMPRLWLFTQQAQSHEQEPVNAQQTVLWGLGRTLAHEQPRWECSLMDLPAEPSAADIACCCDLLSGVQQETQYLIRAGHPAVARLVHRLVPAHETLLPAGLRPDSTYVIVGGLKGLGWQVALWMIQQGVRHLVLLGRSAPTADIQEQIGQLELQGIQIWIRQADVTSTQQMSSLFTQIREQFPPLRGLIQAAAIIQDSILLNLTAQGFAAVLAPKVQGSWNLHTLTLTDPLDFFILFSSISSLLGSPGQGNYAGANGFLDGLAFYRRQRGLPALSINWGPWADVGLAAQQANRGERMALRGFTNLAPQQGLAALQRLLEASETAPGVGVFALNLRQLRQSYPTMARAPFFASLVTEEPASKGKTRGQALRETLLAMETEHERQVALEKYVREQVAQVLRMAPVRIDLHTSLQTLGIDSLMALEVRNRLEDVCEITLSATLLWSYPTVAALAGYLASQLTPLLKKELPQSESLSGYEASIPAVSHLNDFSKDEIAALLAQKRVYDEPIAIIGMGCRFPGGVKNPADFWELLRTGRDAITEVPAERWDVDAYYDPDVDAPGKMASRWGGFIDHADQFDPAFFGISPREAISMDPQQRIFLEVSWEALEQAGQTFEKLAGSQTGIFVGVLGSEYHLIQSSNPADIDTYLGTGTSDSIVAGRLSYILDLRGPSITIDTACSSSLVAFHLACQSLRNEECTLAIAGGVNMILDSQGMVAISKMHMLAPDGRCKTFDSLADGFVRGEGCGVVVLKRLSQAQKDGDPILALVRGSAINQDGHSNGLTAPNVQAQQAVIRQALQQAHIPVEQMGFIETHGTGTSLGDPIEVEALRAVYGATRSDGSQCALGAVKTNLGHLEGAAGVAGLIKTVLALQNGEVPPNLHFRALNPNILLEQTPFVIPTTTQTWPVDAATRYAAVSSFGWSGTNAHVILEAPPQESVQVVEKQAGSNPIVLLPLSARSPEALTQLALAYTSYLQHLPDDQLIDLCFTASQRRSHHPYRLAVLGRQRLELLEQLQAVTAASVDQPASCPAAAQHPLLVLVFSGHGSQWSGMGRDLLEQEPVFRQAMQRCAQVIEPLVSWSLLDVLADPSPEALAPIDVIQPVLFAIQVSLAALWHSWGITPDAVIGHSMGEVAAAYVAGILSLEDAACVICSRSRLLRRISGQGAMALVELSLSQAHDFIAPWADRLSVAVSNSPRSTVLSGDPTALASVLQQLETQGTFARRVKIDVASHSPQIDPLGPDLLEALADLHPQTGLLPLYSTVTAALIEGTHLDAAYWFNNLRQPVLFAEGIRQLLGQGYSHFVELSPHPILVPAIEEGLRDSGEPGLVVASLRRQEESALQLRRALAALYVSGVIPHWHLLQPAGRNVALPAYPWQHERYWPAIDGRSTPKNQRITNAKQPLLGVHIALSMQQGIHYWEMEYDPGEHIHFNQYHIKGLAVLSEALLVEMVMEASQAIFGAQTYTIEQVTCYKLLKLADQQRYKIQVVLTVQSPTKAEFQILSCPIENKPEEHKTSPGNPWQDHLSGKILAAVPIITLQSTYAKVKEIRDHRQALPGDTFYTDMQQRGVKYGPDLQIITQMWSESGTSLAQLYLPARIAKDKTAYQISPGLFTAYTQILIEAIASKKKDSSDEKDTYLFEGFDQLQMYQRPHVADGEFWGYVSCKETSENMYQADFVLLDRSEQVLLEIKGGRVRHLKTVLDQLGLDTLADMFYEVRWEKMAETPPHTTLPPLVGEWLIFADDGGVGLRFQEALQQRGASAALVYKAETFARLSEHTYQLNPLQEDAFTPLFKQHWGKQESTSRHIVYLWACGEPLHEQLETARLGHIVETTCVEFLALVQALAHSGWRDMPRLWLFTQQAQLHEQEPVNAQQTVLWGLGRTLAHEQPRWECSLMDLPAEPSPADIACCCDLLSGVQQETQYLIRAGHPAVARLVHRLVPAHETLLPAGLRPDSTYMIVGGLKGLGWQVALWMIQQGVRHLVLLGRSAPTADIQEQIGQLELQGIQIWIRQADVTSTQQMSSLFTQIREQFPPLRGLIQAAAVIQDSILLNLTAQGFAAVLAPKVQGSWNLHTLTLTDPLDFFVLFSGGASLLGSPGQGNYAGANGFLDGLAFYRRQRGLPALSINWGPWADVGLAAQQANRGERMALRGFTNLAPQQGLAALQRLLEASETAPGVGVFALNLRQLRQSYPTMARAPFFASLVTEEPASKGKTRGQALRETLLAMETEHERQVALEKYVREQVAQVLRMAPVRIDLHTSLQTLGIDSLMALEVRNRLEDVCEITLSATLLWSYPTVAALAEYLASRLTPSSDTEESQPLPLPEAEVPASVVTDLEPLSTNEIADLLAQRLMSIRKNAQI